jgi:hypothetical protein
MIDKNTYNELKKDLNDLSKKIDNLIGEDYEKGDFWNSGASKQTWSQFFNLWSVNPLIAVTNEVSSWHGERKIVLMDSPTSRLGSLFGEKGLKMQVSENWETWTIKSGTKASDIIDGVKSDEKGEYYPHKVGNQIVKLYLPNQTFFNRFAGCLYKFKTDLGRVYTCDLKLASNLSNYASLVSGTKKDDPWITSMNNLDPNLGNGWEFELGENAFPYFRKEGNKLIQVRNEELVEDIRSSFDLFWDKWGVTIQITAAVVLAFFTAGVGGALLGFVEAYWSGSAFATFLAGSTILGVDMTVSGSVLLAEFLLESVVNLSAAYIDNLYGNKYGAALGIAFCFFPPIIRIGKVGKFISGNFTEEAAQQLSKKIMDGVYENMSKEDFVKFLGNLSPQEKLWFSDGMAWLMKEGNGSKLQTFMKDSLESAIKNKTFPSKFTQWLKTKGYELSKTLGAAGVYWAASTAVFVLVKKLQEENNDTRSEEEVKKDAQENMIYITNKFDDIDNNPSLTKGYSSLDVINTMINDKDPEKAAKVYYNLSRGDRNMKVELQTASKLLQLAKQNTKDLETLNSILSSPADFQKTNEDLKKLNKLAGNIYTEKEINSILVKPDVVDSLDPLNIENLLSDSNHPMNVEYNQLITKYPCLKDNFQAVEGDYSYDPDSETGEMWWIKMKPISSNNPSLITPIGMREVKSGEYLYIFNDGKWYIYPSENHVIYKEFKCSE